jgi:hypothetical protein
VWTESCKICVVQGWASVRAAETTCRAHQSQCGTTEQQADGHSTHYKVVEEIEAHHVWTKKFLTMRGAGVGFSQGSRDNMPGTSMASDTTTQPTVGHRPHHAVSKARDVQWFAVFVQGRARVECCM